MSQLRHYAPLSGLLLLGCLGRVGEPPPTAADPTVVPDAGPAPPTPPGSGPTTPRPTDTSALSSPGAFGESGLRRLSRVELRADLHATYGVDPGSLLDDLPEGGSPRTPFDNDFTAQGVSVSLIQSLASVAERYGVMVAANAEPLYRAAGCRPSGPDDAVCFGAIVRILATRAWRRPVTTAEELQFASLLAFSVEEGRFEAALELLVEVLLQHPEHLYRLETGTPSPADPTLIALDDPSIATRIAFLITGQGPDEDLLASAERGALTDPVERQRQVERLWGTSEARAHWAHFHAAWLGFRDLTLPSNLADDLRQENARLIERELFEEQRPWLSIFRADQTYLSPTLAEHYGLPVPATPQWVPYPAERGGGVLSHGAFLAQGSKFGDTSPTLRGARMLERVLCGTLGTPPPDVDTDNPPPGPTGACKTELYSMRNDGRCAGCHARTDNLGFGLENLGPTGAWRAHELNRTQCPIDGRGVALGQPFVGPRELGAILAKAPEVERCATLQLFRYATGRPEGPNDEATLSALWAQLNLTPTLEGLLIAMVTSPGFTHRR